MTGIEPIDPGKSFAEQLAATSPDLLREMLSTVVHSLMSAEADAMCGADYGECSQQRVNSRNGYRHRDFDTRVGTIDVAIPKLRSGSYFRIGCSNAANAPNEPSSVVATCYLLGVEVTSGEDGAGWLAFFRDLVARGSRSRTPRTRTRSMWAHK
ncbi:transposase [Nocardia sp. CY41]|uniref:transposase n=1 Tax=Nocardia sp. CY41 TaxID=2608686 RepID=UPI00135CEB73|nr:transposase [Nocardia sp. CY41]